MFGVLTSPSSVLRAALVTVGLIAAAVALTAGLGVGGLTLLGVMLWSVVGGSVAVGAFLVGAGRPLAGAGATVHRRPPRAAQSEGTALSAWPAVVPAPAGRRCRRGGRSGVLSACPYLTEPAVHWGRREVVQ